MEAAIRNFVLHAKLDVPRTTPQISYAEFLRFRGSIVEKFFFPDFGEK